MEQKLSCPSPFSARCTCCQEGLRLSGTSSTGRRNHSFPTSIPQDLKIKGLGSGEQELHWGEGNLLHLVCIGLESGTYKLRPKGK